MLKFAVEILISAWILSPAIFGLGWMMGIWRTGYDWVIFLAFGAISTFIVWKIWTYKEKH